MNGIIYGRVSSKEQTEGTSLESQELACREYAREKNITILKTFIERGESAKFADRTQLLELIEFCRQNKGRIQVLLVWKVDRFARNVADHFNVKATLTKYGVRIVSVTEPIDTKPEGKLMETILAGFAQFDNDIRAMRTVQGMKRKLQEGIFPWKPPLGYKSMTTSGEKKTERDRPDHPLFGLLQKIWQEFGTGAYTKADVQRLMNSRGIVTRKGRSISAQSLDNLFRNPYYAGVLADPWSGEEYEGKHIPMVSREEFAKIQQIVGGRNRSIPHQKTRPEFPLRGLVRCGNCLRHLTGSFCRGRSRRYPYYNCHSKSCPRRGKSLSASTVHDEFETFLTEIAPKEELTEKLGQMILCTAEKREEWAKAKKARTEATVGRLNRELQELIRMRTQGLINDDEFLAQKTILLEQRHAIEGSVENGNSRLGEIKKRLSEITQPLSQLSETWKILPEAFRPRFQRLILPVGFPAGKIGTAELGLLFKAFGQFANSNSSAVALKGKSWNHILLEITEFSDLLRAYRNPEGQSREPVRTVSSE